MCIYFFLILTFFGILSEKSFADPMTFQSNRLDVHLSMDYFSTTANHNSQGNTFTHLDGSQSYTNWTTDLYGRYGVNERLAVFGNLKVGYASSVGSQFERTASGLSEGGLGVNYLLWYQYVLVNLEFFAEFPFTPVDLNSDEVLYGEGSTNVGFRTLIGKNFNALLFYGYLGYTARSEGRATLIPWGLVARSKFDFWIVESSIRGYENLGDDRYSNQPSVRTAVTDRVNGGSLYFFGVNPKLIRADVALGYKFSYQTQGLIGFGTTITGANSASGTSMTVALRYFFGETPQKRLRRLRESARKEKNMKNLNRFELETDKTDVELFETDEELHSDSKKYEKLLRETEKELEGE